MDIIKFLNSRDIAEHLRKINYEFSPLEAMTVIYMARNVPLKEKHEAYAELIKTYPDYFVETGSNNLKSQPLSSFLGNLIDMENKLIEECMREEDSAIYYATRFYKESNSWGTPDFPYSRIFSTYNECFSKNNNEVEDFSKFSITKKYIASYKHIELTLLRDGTVLNVYADNDEYKKFFSLVDIKIPTPFTRGDILIDTQEWASDNCVKRAFVLDGLYSDKLYGYDEDGKISRMWYTGYFQSDYDLLFFEDDWNYLNLEFYRGELTGKKGILKAMSNYLKGNINGELFMKAYHVLALRDAIKKGEKLLFFSGGEKLLADVGINIDSED